MSRNAHDAPQLSIVVPLFNEAGTIHELHQRLTEVLFLIGLSSEIVYVDDGSSDGTTEALTTIAEHDPRVRLTSLARNYGQTAALAAGFDAASGEVIVAMDGDLQHAPEEIPKLLAKLGEGYDIVSGWREQRVDNLWTRRVPSRIANWLMAKLSGVSLHDFGTTFKAYRAPVIKRIRLHGDLHRFIPALASWGGARIAEVPIANIPRPQSQSHYGLSRTWRVAADLITVRFLLRYVTRPLHFFGPVGFSSVARRRGGRRLDSRNEARHRRAGVSRARSAAAAERGAGANRHRADRPRTARRARHAHLHGRTTPAHLHGGRGGDGAETAGVAIVRGRCRCRSVRRCRQ